MKLLVVDGNSIANRAFYGVRLLSTKNGEFTNALFGFLNILQKLRDMSEPDGIAVAFDLHAPTFRHKLYDEYKAGRKGMPDELRSQMPVLKQLLTLMGCTVIEQEGFEADDLLGTLSAACVRSGDECVIATGDRDALQLVSDQVHVLLAATKMGKPETIEYTPDAVMEKYGLTPAQLIDLKALMGDASDHIPGVPGVGEKTATDLVRNFGSLDAVYAQIESDAIRDGVRAKLQAGKESAYMSRTLGTICCEAPIDTDPSHYVLRPMQKAELAALLARLEFFKWIEKWGLTGETVAAEPPNNVVAVTAKASSLDEAIAAAQRTGRVDLLDNADGGCIVSADGLVAETKDIATIIALCEDATVQKRVHDSKAWFARLLANGKQPTGFVMDTMLAAYLLNPLASGYDWGRLVQEYTVSVPENTAVGQAVAFAKLADTLAKMLKEQEQDRLLIDMELPLALVLADMEQAGVAVDADGLHAFGEMLDGQITDLQTGIYEAIGYTFNLNSPKQLAKALFEDLGLPAKKKTKSGYSTNAEVLESLRNEHPAVAMLLDYRMLAKLKSTYCDGLEKVIGEDGRIHSSFSQTETRTGRISSAEPNLQNIPVRQPLGREMRRFFHAKEGYVLCDADYSQIELRVLAHMANDTAMIDAFNQQEDIHRITASQVFGVPEEWVTPQMRSHAKAVNFGIVYGIGPHSLSQDIGVSYKEAKQYIDSYLAHYGGIRQFMEDLIEQAKRDGYAKTLFGRRRPLPELTASQAMMRAFGERVARNMPIQGTAADIIKIAMVRVYRRLATEMPDAKLILQVHDELIVEAKQEDADRVAQILQQEMEQAAALKVTLSVEAKTGHTWYDTKE